MQIKNHVTSWEGKKEIDVTKAKKVYDDLKNDRAHAAPCSCPSCLYHEHKKQGGKYNKEAFFLSWLEFEIIVSMVKQEERIVFETAEGLGTYKIYIDGRELLKSMKGHGRIKALSEFLKNNFPEIDHNHKRLKLKLWRFKKSKAEAKAEREINNQWTKTAPKEKKEEWEDSWKTLSLVQEISDYIRSLPNKRIDRSTLLRGKFQGKSVDDLKRIHGLLQFQGIFHKREGYRNKTTVYFVKKGSK